MGTRITKPSTAMRKAPRQARSRATIEAILDAAARILGERGWSGVTTNLVAEVAGVSIGSLYQYFPHKRALVEAVRRRHFDEILQVLRASTDLATPRTRRIAIFVDGMIASHSRFPAAHHALMEQVPRDDGASNGTDTFERRYRSGCKAFFAANARYKSADGTALRAQVLAAAVAGVIHDAAHQGTLGSPPLRRELTLLVEAYLARRS